jgi:hypothetical protein
LFAAIVGEGITEANNVVVVEQPPRVAVTVYIPAAAEVTLMMLGF